MIICSIDQSFSSTGVHIFYLNSEEVLAVYLIKTLNKDKKTKKEYSKEERIRYIVNEISNILNKHNCDYVFLEGLSYNNRNSISARDLAGLYYSLLVKFLDIGINYREFPPKSVKAFALKGTASKEELFQKVPEEVKKKI